MFVNETKKEDIPMIDLRGVDKYYKTAAGDYHALKSIDLRICAGEFVVSGFTNKQLRNKYLLGKSASQITRLLKRLQAHGVIKKSRQAL